MVNVIIAEEDGRMEDNGGVPADPTAENIDEPAEPMLRVVKGDPTAAELVAVVSAVSTKFASSTGSPASTGATGEHGWAAYWRRLRQPVRPGRGAWRASGLPS